MTPHVAHTRCAAAAAMNGRTTRHGGYAVSPRKHIEECLGWLKTIAPKVWEFNELLIHVSFIKSTSGQELPGGESAWCNRPRRCRARAPAPTRKFRTHHNVSENGNRVGRPDYPRSAFTPPHAKCTGAADRRLSPSVRGARTTSGCIRPAERPASPYSVRYEFCHRDSKEHMRG